MISMEEKILTLKNLKIIQRLTLRVAQATNFRWACHSDIVNSLGMSWASDKLGAGDTEKNLMLLELEDTCKKELVSIPDYSHCTVEPVMSSHSYEQPTSYGRPLVNSLK